MELSKILLQRRGADLDDNPYAVHQIQHSCRTISYKHAKEYLVQHQEWLKTSIFDSFEERITHASPDSTIVIAYLSNNSPDLFLSVISATSSCVRALPALINTRWTVAEVGQALQSTNSNDMTLLLYGPEFRETAEEASRIIAHFVVSLPIPSLVRLGPIIVPESDRRRSATTNDYDLNACILELSRLPLSHDDALIVFTSGTTSGPKGVRLSHRALVMQALAKLQPPCRYSSKTVMLATTVPFFHVGGLSSILAVWLAGGTLIFPGAPGMSSKFDPSRLLDSLSHALPSNTLVMVPAMIFAVQKEMQPGETFPYVDLILIGGQSASNTTIDFLTETYPNARVVQTYACTEAASSMTFFDVTAERSCLVQSLPLAGDCVGVTPRHVRISIFDATKQPSLEAVEESYTPGIIGTAGAHVMNGYWRRGGLNPVRRPEEWYLTNDLGFWDEENRLYFCGRANDVIRTGGETVLASEVERILAMHPSVVECAVFALPDERFGEAVCCALVCSGSCPCVSEVRKFCAKEGTLAGYKRPRRLFEVEELPRNSSGKILKFLLQERFKDAGRLRSKL
jgi:fatty-acyl-CoA synthase